ncbi:hypothetical protein [Herbiconiux daphne]|uniref:DUF465 domain-containing protein n=1 Tax=Herbiconiux daphne TaxID=2970914 RepID=A0ABT2H544_9MICO|nr:hypothetical protein [Herbiconiux daphne]MCS5735059.1 hypothetical protein [Herbiconiux daphne]
MISYRPDPAFNPVDSRLNETDPYETDPYATFLQADAEELPSRLLLLRHKLALQRNRLLIREVRAELAAIHRSRGI